MGKQDMYRYAYAAFGIKNGEEFVIGRDPTISHIIVDARAEEVSRKHCSVSYDSRQRQYIVTDYSRNGTYLDNGTRLKNKVMELVACGTTLYLGNRNNSFVLN